MKTIKLLSVIGLISALNLSAQPDLREYQHGIDLLKLNNGNYYLIWASQGNPPTSAGGNWTHNIFYSTINPSAPSITPVKWISANEAQEPASSAINAAGTKIFCTWEDGNNAVNEVAQRYFESSSTLGGASATNYSNASIFLDGGHSGHVAAVGNYFVSTWANDWVDGGGVDNLGSGDEVFVSVVDASGTLVANNVSLASGRQWWSDIAGSATKACVVWQSFVNGQQYADLKMMIYDPATGAKGSVNVLMSNVLYYHYSIKYIPAIDRFLVMASKDGGAGANAGRLCAGGKAFLVDNNGVITASKDLTDGIIRESQSIVDGNRVVQTRLQNGESLFGNNSAGGNSGGIMIFDLTPSSITLSQTINDSYQWEYMGNDGYFQDCSTVVIFSLSTAGIQTKTFSVNCLPTNIDEKNSRNTQIFAYPNPFSQSTTIDLSSIQRFATGNLSFVLYDLIGQKVETFNNISEDKLIIDKKNKAEGMYMYRVLIDGNIIGTGKLVIQ